VEKEEKSLLAGKFGLALRVAGLAYAVATRNIFLILLSIGSLSLNLPFPRLKRFLYTGTYLCVAAIGVLLYGWWQGVLQMQVYVAAGALSIFGLAGLAAASIEKKHPK
jgi:hypothetical protein